MHRLLAGIFAIALLLSPVSAGDWVEDSVRLTHEDTLAMLPAEFELEESGFLSNLDSLLNLWYVEKSVSSPDDWDTALPDSVIPDFPDSVYIERLSRIPVILDLSYNEKVRRYIEVYANKRRKQLSRWLKLREENLGRETRNASSSFGVISSIAVTRSATK